MGVGGAVGVALAGHLDVVIADYFGSVDNAFQFTLRNGLELNGGFGVVLCFTSSKTCVAICL